MEKFEYKGTPGPWDVQRGGYGDGDFTIKSAGPEGYVAHSIGGLEEEEEKSNAHLIAAAPDLLEALHFCRSVIGTQGMFDRSEQLAYEKASAAIAKALNLQP